MFFFCRERASDFVMAAISSVSRPAAGKANARKENLVERRAADNAEERVAQLDAGDCRGPEKNAEHREEKQLHLRPVFCPAGQCAHR
jgi:hypothetical protein